MNRKKIALVHPQVNIGGGSEAVLFWIIQALCDQYDLTVITSNQFNIDLCNRFYQTNIRPDEVRVIAIHPPRIFKNPQKFNALRGFRLGRFCKKDAHRFDLMFSTYNLVDFGKKGIQYILDPNFNEKLIHLLNPTPRKWMEWFYKDSIIRKIYLSLGRFLSGYKEKGMKENLTIVDSKWAGKMTSEALGITTRTLYPPAPGVYIQKEWESRSIGFICMGRIIPDKEIDKIIEILRIIREKGWDIHLHILGRIVDRQYLKKLEKLIQVNSSWIKIDRAVMSEKKYEMLSNHRFGIHGKSHEPFGIAAAEMVRAGMIVWVPNGGGQVEIVDHPMLIYDGINDVVNKIERVIKDDFLQQEIRMHLVEQSKIFSTDRFMNEVKLLVKDFIDGKI